MADDTYCPVVDLSCLTADVRPNELEKISKQIVDGFQRSGFVYLKNHGLTLNEMQEFVTATDQFYELDEDIKLRYRRNVETIHGYSTQKDEVFQSTVSNESKAERNNFDIQGLDEPFPDKEVPQMKIATKNILSKALVLVRHILKCLEIGLGLEENALLNKHKLMMQNGNYTDLRSIRYQPPEKKEHVNRLEAHYDFDTLTFQLYNDLAGLELMDKTGVWQKANVSNEWILLFPSEIFQRFTGDKIKSLKHQVVIPDDEADRRKTRHSVLLFVHPDDDVIIEDLNGSEKYEPISAIDFANLRIREYFITLMAEKNARLKLT